MKPVEVIFFFGASCISPITPVDGGTVVEKVPCAEVVYLPAANPYKITQEQNAITVAPQQPPRVKKASRLCGSKRAVWFVKNGKKRYRCR